MGEQLAKVGDLELCYETFGSDDAPPLLLIQGLGAQMLLWEDEFCGVLADRGHRVIRFDNRDVGRSTHLTGARVPTQLEVMRRDPDARVYKLEDMADDSAGLLDALQIDSANVVGASMGGMIAQLLTVRHPDRVRSLTSIMSTTGNRRVGGTALRLLPRLLSKRPTTREAYVADFVYGWELIGSPVYRPDPQRSAVLAERCFDRGIDPAGATRQLLAAGAAKDRTALLGQIKVPTTVIHGDRDELVKPSGGIATAMAIPGARMVLIPGMGHHFPVPLWARLADEITATCESFVPVMG